jgi:FAD/FMN-containing dehydrogenase
LPSVFEPDSIAAAAELLTGGGRVSIDRDGGDVVLSTKRLNRVLEHEPGDLTAIVEAGIRLSELQSALATHGQMLALDPPGDPTIGACLAGDLSGPRRHRYGAIRDLVIGVTVVLADGSVASAGGKVVKNVAGFDLGKLFCGSRGRLGLIARVALRLHPRPRDERTLVGPAGRWQAVHRSQLDPIAADLLWPGEIACEAGADRRVAGRVEREHLPVRSEASLELGEADAGLDDRRQVAGLVLVDAVESPRREHDVAAFTVDRDPAAGGENVRGLGHCRRLRDARQDRPARVDAYGRGPAPRRRAGGSGTPCLGWQARPGRSRRGAGASPRGRAR